MTQRAMGTRVAPMVRVLQVAQWAVVPLAMPMVRVLRLMVLLVILMVRVLQVM